jgi:hypothetical protein
VVALACAVVLELPRVAGAGAMLFAIGSATALQQYLRLLIPSLTRGST